MLSTTDQGIERMVSRLIVWKIATFQSVQSPELGCPKQVFWTAKLNFGLQHGLLESKLEFGTAKINFGLLQNKCCIPKTEQRIDGNLDALAACRINH